MLNRRLTANASRVNRNVIAPTRMRIVIQRGFELSSGMYLGYTSHWSPVGKTRPDWMMQNRAYINILANEFFALQGIAKDGRRATRVVLRLDHDHGGSGSRGDCRNYRPGRRRGRNRSCPGEGRYGFPKEGT